MRNGSGYRKEIDWKCTNHNKENPTENHNQLFTLFISRFNTLVRNITGNCSRLRAHKKSSWHFDFSSFYALKTENILKLFAFLTARAEMREQILQAM